MRILTEDQLRKILKKRVSGRTLTSAAQEIGISLPMLSMLMNGAPLTGKAVRFLGYRKIRQRMYESLPKKKGGSNGC